VNDTGRCTNQRCSGAARREPIERYPGPGQYCPDCGELLEAQPPAPSRGRRTIVLACAGAVVLAVAVAIVSNTQLVPALAVRVCTSTMSNRVAREIVRDYAGRHRIWPFHYTLTAPGNLACDVRFYAAPAGSEGSMVASDAVVAVVNPQNGIARLALPQLRDVLAGRIVDWSQLGGPRGTIVAAVPPDGSDEAQAVASRVMLGQPFGPQVIRNLETDQIARSVSSPSGARWIGIVPFSAALPAKVIALGSAPPPSPISIADGRYPIAVRILAESDFRFPGAPAAGLIAFARSSDANGIIVRDALVSKENL
jgi:hypothetical protein